MALDDKVAVLKKKLGEILYRDIEKKAEVELGDQKLPPKDKMIQMIYGYINQFTEVTMKKMLSSYFSRAKIVEELIDNIVAYF